LTVGCPLLSVEEDDRLARIFPETARDLAPFPTLRDCPKLFAIIDVNLNLKPPWDVGFRLLRFDQVPAILTLRWLFQLPINLTLPNKLCNIVQYVNPNSLPGQLFAPVNPWGADADRRWDEA
jgi:hypothetical protein